MTDETTKPAAPAADKPGAKVKAVINQAAVSRIETRLEIDDYVFEQGGEPQMVPAELLDRRNGDGLPYLKPAGK